jgi:signal transduction histidine kinase
LDVDILPLWGDPGERLGWLITFVDITSVRRLEEDKRRLDRLAVLGEMSANVAHEVRNPLASIKTSMQMLASEIVGGQVCGKNDEQNDVQEWALESIDVVLKEVERLDTIVRELLQFARPRQLQRSACSIVEVSDRVLHLLQRQCSEANIVVQRMYAPVPMLYADVAQMEQVLLNLYMNAIQAMPDGGSLIIASRLIAKKQALSEAREAQEVPPISLSMGEAGVLHGRSVRVGEENKGEQWLELAVSDTGPGIAPDQAERIFQPFFTTRAHGIGLGLAITRRLVEDHGGYIGVGGQTGYGAMLSVRLPLLPELYEPNEEENEEENDVEGGNG